MNYTLDSLVSQDVTVILFTSGHRQATSNAFACNNAANVPTPLKPADSARRLKTDASTIKNGLLATSCQRPNMAANHERGIIRPLDSIRKTLIRHDYNIESLPLHERHLYLDCLAKNDKKTLDILNNIYITDDSDNHDLLFHVAAGRLSIAVSVDEYDERLFIITKALMGLINHHYSPLGNQFYIFNWHGHNDNNVPTRKVIFPKNTFTGDTIYLILEAAQAVFEKIKHQTRFFIPVAIIKLINYLNTNRLTELEPAVIDNIISEYKQMRNVFNGVTYTLKNASHITSDYTISSHLQQRNSPALKSGDFNEETAGANF